MITGNDEPTDEPLLQRLFYIIINKPDYSEDQAEAYRDLLDQEEKGVGQVTLEILQHRLLFESEFKSSLRKCNDEIKAAWSDKISKERVRGNMSVLLACYDVLNKVLEFPFKRQQLLDIMVKNALVQMDKIESGSDVATFFKVVQYMIQQVIISEGNHFIINSNRILIRYGLIYPLYQKCYYDLEKERAPSKAVLLDSLKRSDVFIEAHKNQRFGKNGVSSCYSFDLEKSKLETLMGIPEQQTIS